MHVSAALAQRYLEAVMHVNQVGKRRGWDAVHERRGARGDGTFGRGHRGSERGRGGKLERAAVTMAGSCIVKRPSKSHATCARRCG
jgi:hypothetical protein